jgi:mannan endo-1,4-beta-mannosidase
MKIIRRGIFVGLICLVAACAVQYIPPVLRPDIQTDNSNFAVDPQGGLITADATAETAALYQNLKILAKTNIMFGHMEDNQTGYDGWLNTPGRSDVYDIAGAYPAVYGFDFGRFVVFRPEDVTEKDADATRAAVIEAYKRNGVITFSWHYNNPVSRGSFYWKDSPVNAVQKILYDGKTNKTYTDDLKKIARFAASVQVDGKLIPIIFRPFHEFDGDWFWWGSTHCTAQEYKLLYRYTVTYLRDELHVKNFIYAWSPDCKFTTRQAYLERYPGNQYVDLVGMDEYSDLKAGKSPAIAAAKFSIVSNFALANKKAAALTETGLENLTLPDWYTAMLLKALKISNAQLAYAMVWANHPNAYWTPPYHGHPSEPDFLKFKNDPYVVFGDRMGNMYSSGR